MHFFTAMLVQKIYTVSYTLNLQIVNTIISKQRRILYNKPKAGITKNLFAKNTSSI